MFKNPAGRVYKLRRQKKGESDMSDKVKIYSSADMEFENLSKNHLALVDFWATWCGPCRMMAPVIDELAEEMPDVVFAKVNVDENPDLAMDLGIQAIPTMILYRDGEIVERVIGVSAKDALKEIIDKAR